MFSKKKDMKSVIAGFTSEAKAIAAVQQEVANAKRAEIAAAQAELVSALAEIQIADTFIANMEAMAQPAEE